jgi:hypothetical protein
MRLYNHIDQDENYNYDLSGPFREENIIKYYLTFSSPYHTGIKQNDLVHVELRGKEIISQSGIKSNNIEGIVILVHGFASRNEKMQRYYHFSDSIIEKGMTCAIISLPYHLERTPPGEISGDRLITFDDLQTLKFFHQAVVDIRKLIDILEKIYMHSGIYICGTSLGCMVSTIAMAFDDRISKGSLLICGGNWEEIHWKGILRFILKGNCAGEENSDRRSVCRKAYSQFPLFLEEIKKVNKSELSFGLENLKELKKVTPKSCFLCDPMAYAHMINTNKVIMINCRLDFYFSRKSIRYLWKELGKPEIIWSGFMHSSNILKKDRLINIIYDFFTEKTKP